MLFMRQVLFHLRLVPFYMRAHFVSYAHGFFPYAWRDGSPSARRPFRRGFCATTAFRRGICATRAFRRGFCATRAFGRAFCATTTDFRRGICATRAFRRGICATRALRKASLAFCATRAFRRGICATRAFTQGLCATRAFRRRICATRASHSTTSSITTSACHGAPATKSAHRGSQSAAHATKHTLRGSQIAAPATKSAHRGSQSAVQPSNKNNCNLSSLASSLAMCRSVHFPVPGEIQPKSAQSSFYGFGKLTFQRLCSLQGLQCHCHRIATLSPGHLVLLQQSQKLAQGPGNEQNQLKHFSQALYRWLVGAFQPKLYSFGVIKKQPKKTG